MAMTELILVFMAGMALLATLGIFVDFDDRWTRLLVEAFAAVLWGMVAMSAYDVVLPGGGSDAVMPMVVLGFAMSFLLALYALYDLVTGATDEVRDTGMELGG